MSDKPDPLAIAISHLTTVPQWAELEKAMRERRESWIADMAGPLVYQNHAELVQVSARVAEIDYWLSAFAGKQPKDDKED